MSRPWKGGVRQSLVVAGVVGIAALALALRQVEWAGVATALAKVSPLWLVAAAIAHTASYLMMAVRWRILAHGDHRPSFVDSFDFLMIGAMASFVLPAKLNEVARAVGAARYWATSSSSLMGTIVLEKLLDVIVLLAIGATLSFLMDVPPLVQSGMVALFAGALALSVVLWLGPSGPLGAVQNGFLRFRGPSSRVLPRLVKFMEGISSFREREKMPRALLAATAVGVLSAAAVGCTLAAFHLPVPIYAGAFVILLVNLGGLIPAPPAGVGLYHYLVMQALSPWVHDSSAAFACALVMHALSISVVLVIGSASFIRKGLSLQGIRRLAATDNQEPS